MKIEFPTRTLFYSIEQAIKQYRKMSQKNIAEAIPDITVDHALVLILLQQRPDRSQVEIAELLFKDYASITRMIALMVRNGYLRRSTHSTDKRKSILNLTPKAHKSLEVLLPIIQGNREKALQGLGTEDVAQLQTTLRKLIQNCS